MIAATKRHILALIPALACLGSAGAQEPADLNAAAATYFGTSLRQTLQEMRAAGAVVDSVRFEQLLIRALNGEDLGLTRERAEEIISGAMGLNRRQQQPPAVPAADAEAETAWVKKQLELPRTEELAGGVVLQRLVEGSGEVPGPESAVMVMYSGRLSSGAEFDKTDEPFLMPVNRVVPGLSLALQHMRCGGTYRVFIPPAEAYGSEAVMDLIPAYSALDFTIEPLSIKQ